MAKFDMAAHVRRINSQDKIATGILTAIVGLVLLILAAIVIYILVAGAGKLFDVSFLTSKPQQFKAGGGIGPELFNSFYLLFLTLVISVPLSLGAAIYLSQYAPENWVTSAAKTIIETLSSLPSIVVGLFGFLFFVLTMGWGFSVIAGAVALTMFNIPILVYGKVDGLGLVQVDLVEGEAPEVELVAHLQRGQHILFHRGGLLVLGHDLPHFFLANIHSPAHEGLVKGLGPD